jgi:hypothetical protein
VTALPFVKANAMPKDKARKKTSMDTKNTTSAKKTVDTKNTVDARRTVDTKKADVKVEAGIFWDTGTSSQKTTLGGRFNSVCRHGYLFKHERGYP